jgi:hypothetical protein
MTLNQLINETGITLTSERVSNNPHMDGSERMNNYKVKLRAKHLGNATMRLYYSKGYGHNGAEPTADEVLDCLASDASFVVNSRSFEDWCADLGYDTDSRKAEKTFKTCERQAERLQKFLGTEYYETLLWNIERL